MKYAISLIVMFISASSCLLAEYQSDTLKFTLEECLMYALENNHPLKNSAIKREIAYHEFKKIYSQGLPQVNAFGNFSYYPAVPVLAVDGSLLGKPELGTINVEAGTSFDTYYGVMIRQPIFDFGHMKRVDIARETVHLEGLNHRQKIEDLAFNIGVLFYETLITKYEINLHKENLIRLENLLQIGKVKFEEDIITNLDLDRLRVSKTNLETAIEQLQVSYANQLRFLKLEMGVFAGQPLEIYIDFPGEFIENLALTKPDTFLINNNLQFRILQCQKEISEVSYKSSKGAFLPVVSGFARYNRQNLTNDFDLLKQDANWFNVSVIGIQVDIPMFMGFGRYHENLRATLDLELMDHTEIFLCQRLKTFYNNAEEDYHKSYNMVLTQFENKALAEKVYNRTQFQYENQLANLTDLMDAGNSMIAAQNALTKALLRFKISELELYYASGDIGNLLNIK